MIDTRLGPAGTASPTPPHVDRLYTGGVVLALDAAAPPSELPEPSANPAVLDADPDDTAPDDLGDKLKRAWNWISGNY